MDWWIWVALGFVLLAGEVVAPGGFYAVFFGLGALATGLLAAAGWVQPLAAQGTVFAVLSVAALAVFRPLLTKRLRASASGDAIDNLEGSLARAYGPIDAGGHGQVELRGTTWKARNTGASPLIAGQDCRVERVEGLTLWVQAERGEEG